jgi:hypothetical protein
MSSKDQVIYNQIGRLLIRYAPIGAVTVIYQFKIDAEESFEEGAVYGFEYDYINQSGEKKWFTIDNLDDSRSLVHLLLELRSFFISQGQPTWKSCEFSVDLSTGKFSVGFKYA